MLFVMTVKGALWEWPLATSMREHFSTRFATSVTISTTTTLAAMFSIFIGLLKRAAVFILVNDVEANALVDTGSSESLISYDSAQRLKLKMDSTNRNGPMASSSLISPINGLCTVNINLLGILYQNKAFIVNIRLLWCNPKPRFYGSVRRSTLQFWWY